MTGQWLSWLLGLTLAVGLVSTDIQAARAQAKTTALLFLPDTGQFPLISVFLDVHDSQGRFVHGIQAKDVRLLEDNRELTISSLTKLHPGVQFVLAITPGVSFDIRDIHGVSRYQHLLRALSEWQWDQENANLDDLSLITAEGDEITHQTSPVEILRFLQSYQPATKDISVSLQALVRALEIVSTSTPRPGMERAILWITSPHQASAEPGLQNLAARASQQNIRIYVWLIAAPDYLAQPQAVPLRVLAEQTGGQFLGFSGAEPLPNLENLLEPLRHVYQITYSSQINQGGEHQLIASLTLQDGQIASPALTFRLDLQPPTPLMISPPTQILRTFATTSTASGAADGLPLLLPAEQIIQISIGFPDGYERPLVRSTLYVDGAIAAENIAPPFDQFTWNLSGYTQDGSHTLQVEVIDSLGLSGLSDEVMVRIGVPRPAQGILAALARQRTLVIGIVVILSGAILTLVLLTGGRIQPRLHVGQRRKKTLSERERQRNDPVTQPLEIAVEKGIPIKDQRIGWSERIQRHQRRPVAIKPMAYLTPLSDSNEVTLPALYPVGNEEIVLGSDPLQATLVLDDPSVDPVHARLQPQQGAFYLLDNGSTAGTWVNYAVVPDKGIKLEHGDLVHVGRVGFRFSLREPSALRKPVVVLQERPG